MRKKNKTKNLELWTKKEVKGLASHTKPQRPMIRD